MVRNEIADLAKNVMNKDGGGRRADNEVAKAFNTTNIEDCQGTTFKMVGSRRTNAKPTKCKKC